MNVVASLGGIFRLCRVFGILPFGMTGFKSNAYPRFVRSKRRLAHTRITCGIFFFAQLYLLWHAVYMSLMQEVEKPLKSVLVTTAVTAAVSILVIFRSLITREEILCRWLNRINEMFSNLKEADLNWVKTISFLSLSGSAVFLTISGINDFYDWEFRDHGKRARKLLVKSYVMVPCFYMSMWEIKLFLQVQLVLVNLVRFHCEEVHDTIRGSVANGNRVFWLGYIRELRVRHLEMHDFLDFVQGFFMPVTSFRLVWGSFNLLLDIMITAKDGIPSLDSFIWMFYIAFDMVVIIYVCHMTEQEGRKTARYLQDKFIGWRDKELWDEIEIFSLQAQHMKIEFTVFGVHRVNFTLLYDMVGSLTSTTVVLLQFQNETFLSKEFCTALLRNLTSEDSLMLFHSEVGDGNLTSSTSWKQI